jgi:SAM-dependent methyltransferase
VPTLLAGMSLEDWGELLLDIPAEYPNLRARFPSMPPDEVQARWVGRGGAEVLPLSVQFVKWLVAEYERVGGAPIRDASVLDFGCGWGRMLRLLYKYVDADQLYGVDPAEVSIQICDDHGVLGHLALSDWVPKTLPFAGPFDLVFAFSVFTHLSERTRRVALETLRQHIADDGLLAITIRPSEFWRYLGRDDLLAEHDQRGFAFRPQDSAAVVDGDVTYGDASMTLDYLAQEFPSWRFVSEHVEPTDPFQKYVLLSPA